MAREKALEICKNIKRTLDKDYVEIIGITGGILSLYGRFQSYFGTMILKIVHIIKERKRMDTIREIEMIEQSEVKKIEEKYEINQ